VFRFAVNALAALVCLWAAVLADNMPWFIRMVLGVIALGSGFAAAVQLPIVQRFANRNAKPS
jgi:hypothetical protein